MPEIPAYERDPRLTRLDTEVLSAGDEAGRPFVVLADTVLYPEGGGQPADRGMVDGVEVVDVQKSDGVIRHFVADSVPVGPVTVELDWARRFDHMQQHTGQHLLTAVADERFGWHTTAFHLGESTCDIELDTPEITVMEMAALEDAVAAEIRAARSVTWRRVSAEEYAGMQIRSRGLPEDHTGAVRLVEIQGIDVNTCGGTHVSSTSEIEALGLLGTESMRGGIRLSWVAGERLRRLLATHHVRNARLRELLGTADEDLVARVTAKLEQLRSAERAVRRLEEELAVAVAGGLAAQTAAPGAPLTGHWAGRDLSFLQRVAREAVQAAPERVVLVTSGEEAGAFVLAAGEGIDLDVQEAGRRVSEPIGGRGGGSGKIFQGKASRMSGRAEAVQALETMLKG